MVRSYPPPSPPRPIATAAYRDFSVLCLGATSPGSSPREWQAKSASTSLSTSSLSDSSRFANTAVNATGVVPVKVACLDRGYQFSAESPHGDIGVAHSGRNVSDLSDCQLVWYFDENQMLAGVARANVFDLVFRVGCLAPYVS